MKKVLLLAFALVALWFALAAQDFSGVISKGQQPHIAIPDLRADSNDAQDQIQGGAAIRDDTPAHPPRRDHHPGGAEIRDDRRPNRGQFR